MNEQEELVGRNCLIYKTLDILSKKWSVFILLELTKQNKPLHYSEIEKKLKGITPRVLSLRLQDLLENKLITKTSRRVNNKLETTYALTRAGENLKPLLEQIRDWGKKYDHCSFSETCSRCSF